MELPLLAEERTVHTPVLVLPPLATTMLAGARRRQWWREEWRERRRREKETSSKKKKKKNFNDGCTKGITKKMPTRNQPPPGDRRVPKRFRPLVPKRRVVEVGTEKGKAVVVVMVVVMVVAATMGGGEETRGEGWRRGRTSCIQEERTLICWWGGAL